MARVIYNSTPPLSTVPSLIIQPRYISCSSELSRFDPPHTMSMRALSDSSTRDKEKNASLEHNETLNLAEGGHDDIQLQRLGKKPVLKRNWGILSVVGLACTILGTWEGLLAGGPAGAVYGYIFSYPIKDRNRNTNLGCFAGHPLLADSITGWLSVVGWQAAFASGAFLFGTQVQGASALAHEAYDPKAYQGTLLMWAFLCIVLITNMVGGKFLPRLESGLLCFHIVGLFGIIIPLLVRAEHKSKEQVFKEFLNGGEFPTQGLSWFVGLSGAAFAFAGGDASVHSQLAEECSNAEIAIPRAMMLTVVINGCLGFGMLLTMLFCSGNIQDALASRSGYPFMEIFVQGTHSMGGALAMTSVYLFAAGCSIFGMLAATSRQFWSFSRDKGVPGWKLWSRVNSRHLPLYSTVLTVIVSALLGLINLGSKLALEDILSMAVSGLYSSYLIVAILLLYRRCKGDIYRYGDGDGMQINVPGARLVWGPFHVPGIAGIILNGYTVMYMTIVVFFSFWPSAMRPEVDSMNYSVVGTCGVVALAVLYYVVCARHSYQGPIMEVQT
ncbi:hypothetical protein N7532_000712 [Penicillium argentinense]|uniref:Uncharacterized protein n=1 Tax=Penicillium argentinense TaxID=1131581 RepID=A0A9W9KP39_9EURO|nr:uncharacterized protein N7532_000712 [Penicillium argentinense]KAJ5112667.1 hypothetical protein N7532_000712 [Penicillium argentinense]